MDKKDSAILELLMKDGREPVTEIARELRLPRSTVHERIHRMVRDGTIQKFVAVPGFAEMGRPTTAYVLVSCEHGVLPTRVAGKLTKISEVYEVALILGRWDILLKIRSASVDNVGELVIKKVRGVEGVAKTETYFVRSS